MFNKQKDTLKKLKYFFLENKDESLYFRRGFINLSLFSCQRRIFCSLLGESEVCSSILYVHVDSKYI